MVYSIFRLVLQWLIASFALQVVAGAMQRQKEWRIMKNDDVKAATALLPFVQPGKSMYVRLSFSTPTQALHQLAATIKQTAYGRELVMKLYHSIENSIPCDDLVKEFHGAK